LISKGSYAATAAAVPASAKDLFAAPNYSAWVREAIRSSSARSDSAVLYGSSISEPTDELVRLVREAFSARVTSRYISVFSDGNRFVADAICARYGVKPEEVVTTTGVTGALAMTIKALVGPGDHVLIEQPGFDLLGSVAREAGAKIVAVTRSAPQFKIDLDRLAGQLSAQTKLILITNLHNPTGAHLTPQEIRDLARLAARVGAILFVDEVYADFMRPAVSAPAATLATNIISANSLTKVFGLHALKCGWMIGAPELLGRIQSQSSEGDGGISKLSHAVAAHVLESAQIFDRRWREVLAFTGPTLRQHADAMIDDGLIEGAVPEFGCMYFPKVVGVEDTTGLARSLWQRYGLLVAPGEYFGMAGHIRIGFGNGETELDEGLARLHRALKEIRDS
jgi:aspartate/methionine/tyrosine aminotransferase